VFEIADASVPVFACLSIFEKEVRLKPDATYYIAVKIALTKD